MYTAALEIKEHNSQIDSLSNCTMKQNYEVLILIKWERQDLGFADTVTLLLMQLRSSANKESLIVTWIYFGLSLALDLFACFKLPNPIT